MSSATTVIKTPEPQGLARPLKDWDVRVSKRTLEVTQETAKQWLQRVHGDRYTLIDEDDFYHYAGKVHQE